MEINTVMVLAAGFGKRMQPITNDIPKPLIPVAGKPLIDGVLDNIAKVPSITKVVVNTHYKADLIHAHIDSIRNKYPFEIIISHEENILETGGGIVNALPILGDSPFYIVNSDNIWLDEEISILSKLADNYDEKTVAVLAVYPTEKAIGYDGAGDFFMTKNGTIAPKNNASSAPYVFIGIHLINPKILADCKKEQFSIMKIYNTMLDEIKAVELDGKWLHVGTPDGVKLAEEKLVELAE